MRSRSSSFSFSSSKQSATAGLILALLVAWFLYPVLVGGQVWLPTRLLSHSYPYRAMADDTPPPWNPLTWDGVAQFGVWRLYAARMWREGWLPLWNPHQGMGYPLYANSQSALFYPPNALFAWLGAGAFGWLAAMHLWWAGMGMWLLLRRAVGVGFTGALIGGIVFTFSLWMVTWQYLPTVPATASWLPWVLVAAAGWVRQPDARRATWWGLAMGLCLLAGHLQIAFYVLLAGVLFIAFAGVARLIHAKRLPDASPPVGRVAVAGSLMLAFALALALSAPQVLPAVELSRYSHRRAPATAEGYAAYVGSAMPFAHLVTLFLPDFFGHPSVARTDVPDVSTYWGKGNYAEFACFVGVPALLLGALGIRGYRSAWRWYALLLAALAMLLALGTPINALLYFGVPGFSGTGSPARVLVLWAFGIALLAALGTQRLTSSRGETPEPAQDGRIAPRDWLLPIGLLGLLFGTSLFAARAMTQEVLGEASFTELFGAQAPMLLQGVALAVLGAGVVFVGQQRGWNALFTRSVLVICVVGSLWMAGAGYHHPAPADSVYPDTPLLAKARALTEGGWRLFAVQGGWSLYRAPQAILPPNLATAAGLYDLQIYDSLMPLHTKRWLDTLNGRDSAPVENGNMALGWRAPTHRLADVGVKAVLSLQSLADPSLRLVEDSAEGKLYEVVGARAWVRAIDGRECVFHWQGSSRLQILLPEGVKYLHVLQTFYPGWKVQPAGSISLLDGTFQHVEVRANMQSVTLYFAPELLRVCLYLALVAMGYISYQCAQALLSRHLRV